MTALEAFKHRFEQYRLHRALLSIDEINYFKQELDVDALDQPSREFITASQKAYDDEEEETWRALDESGKALEASENLNNELTEAKQTLEAQRDELQTAYQRLENQKQALEQQNHELVETRDRLEVAKRKADEDYDDAVERLRVQEQMGMLADKLRRQHGLLSWQNWFGAALVGGTGFLFWLSRSDIIAGAFVTLSSMYLQTLGGNFASFFGQSRGADQKSSKQQERRK